MAEAASMTRIWTQLIWLQPFIDYLVRQDLVADVQRCRNVKKMNKAQYL